MLEAKPVSDKLIQSRYWREKLTAELLYNVDRPHHQNLQRLRWLRKNVSVVCPHCKEQSRWAVAFQGYNRGLSLCRGKECRQITPIFECQILDPVGNQITVDYTWPMDS